jgi:CRP/FNR family transcriptional regulator, anaerobic regulatory protein
MDKALFATPALNREISANARVRKFSRDETLIKPGDDIHFVPIVLKGSVRILRQDADGREVFLYYLFPGETCAMSLTCCQAGAKSMIRAVTEEETEVLQIPVELTGELYKYPEWKAYVSANYNRRFAQLISVIDLVAFAHMDEQLLNYLRQRGQALGVKTLKITHQQIAGELNLHREAVTRLLRTLENKGFVKLGRGSILLAG